MQPAHRRRGRYQIKKRFIAFVALLATLTVALGYCLFAPRTATVLYGSFPNMAEYQGLFIFNEQDIELPEHAKMLLYASQGQRVAQGEELAVLYKTGYPQGVYQDLLDLESNIVQYQNNNIIKDINDIQITEYDFNISRVLKELELEGSKAYTDLYTELAGLLFARQNYVRAQYSPNPYLTQLYTSEAEQLAALQSWKITITAPETGILNYYPASSLLHAEDAVSLTSSVLSEALNKAAAPAALEEGDKTLSVLRDDRCYFAFFMKRHSYKTGDTLSFSVRGLAQPITGRVFSIKDDAADLIVVEITQNIAQLASFRLVTFTPGGYCAGLAVPSGCVRRQGAHSYVKLNKSGTQALVEVRVAMDNGEYAVITSADPDLAAGATVYR